MNKEKKQTFEQAVRTTVQTAHCYRPGLQALEDYAKKVNMKDAKQCGGSLDIDQCVKARFPQENRWDYALCYGGEVYFMEVHTAKPSEVSVVPRKLQWLKDWLHQHAPAINALRATSGTPFFWVRSGKFDFPKNARELRIAAQKGIRPVSILRLPPR